MFEICCLLQIADINVFSNLITSIFCTLSWSVNGDAAVGESDSNNKPSIVDGIQVQGQARQSGVL
jgi:hypothetical protein